ncbi:MAG: hypothetical protein MUF22_03145 [Chitinispirillaceae bacterium]|jgi:predicted ferric reductase|nr:hypothetical protein [Chitinispirillaceae bacterium]
MGAPVRRLLAAFAALTPALALPLYFSGNWYTFFHAYSLGMCCGLLALGCLLNALILSARLRFADRLFGHDRVLVFHGWLAATGLLLAMLHVAFKLVDFPGPSAQTLIGMAGLSLFLLVAAATLCVMVENPLHRIAALARLRSRLLRHRLFDYTRLKLFHNLTAAASLLMAIHVLMASSTGEDGFRSWIMGLWAATALTAYLWHKVIRPLLPGQRFEIAAVTPLSAGITRLVLRPSSGRLPAHRAGQYGFVQIVDPAVDRGEHPFTLSSPPGGFELSITVKSLGDYTAQVGRVSPGAPARFDGPYGLFTPDPAQGPHLFIAGGIGITPFLSILGAWDIRGFITRTVLVHSARTITELLSREKFFDMAVRHPQFEYLPLVTDKDARRIDRALLSDTIAVHEPKQWTAWICGPAALRAAAAGMLRELGVKRVRYEKFSL